MIWQETYGNGQEKPLQQRYVYAAGAQYSSGSATNYPASFRSTTNGMGSSYNLDNNNAIYGSRAFLII